MERTKASRTERIRKITYIDQPFTQLKKDFGIGEGGFFSYGRTPILLEELIEREKRNLSNSIKDRLNDDLQYRILDGLLLKDKTLKEQFRDIQKSSWQFLPAHVLAEDTLRAYSESGNCLLVDGLSRTDTKSPKNGVRLCVGLFGSKGLVVTDEIPEVLPEQATGVKVGKFVEN